MVVEDAQMVRAMRLALRDHDGATAVHDRKYFMSLYVREPTGTLFEYATDAPGFTVDEPAEHLGETLFVPPHDQARAADLRVILPQLLPRLLISLQLMLGSAWLFLIAAEAIASTDGLGYRIFLVRRYLAMDVILPYVAWITLLAWLMDFGLRRASTRLFPWFMVGAR